VSSEPALAGRKRAAGRRLPWRLLAVLAAPAVLWLAGLLWFVAAIPREVADPATPTDAIIVLTGGSQRLAAGLDLLATGVSRRLFVSGVHQGVELGELMRVQHRPQDWLACCITLGHAADSTLGNAQESAAWMRAEGLHSLRLVTASYHMRRSLFEFHRAMPEVAIIAHPVFPDRLRGVRWWASPENAVLVVGEYDKYVGAVLRAALGLEAPEGGQ
jgi:uncharacterized SAM-binding protein YcdF (DUF218 family)